MPFSARMSHSSKEAAARATVGITEAILEEAIARVERAAGAPSAVETPTSEAAPMGDLVQQMAEAAIIDEAEAARKAEEDRLAEEAMRQMRQRKSKRGVLLDKQLSLPARLKRSVRRFKNYCFIMSTTLTR